MRAEGSITAAEAPAGTGRRLFWIGFFGLVLAGWLALFRLMASPLPGVSAAEYWASLCVSAADAAPLSLFAMWVLMTAAMMLPTFVPALRVFSELGAVRATNGPALAALTAGYGLAWIVFAALATALQVALGRVVGASESWQAMLPWVTSGLLVAAGAYQFSAVKAACLAKCRHPLMFFMEHWRPGLGAAFGMGARLGAWCVGCCWVLMLLGFAGGAMNLMWMGAATLFMVFEKLPEIGRYLTRPAGLVLMLLAVAQAARALDLASLGG